MDNWSQVATEDGYTGYIRNEDISEPEQVMFSHESTQPEYTSIQKDYKINLAWHQMTTADGNATLAEMVAGSQGINTISPTWFSIADNSGNITSLASADYVNQAHSMGMEVWALIDNFSTEVDTLAVLSDTQARANIINQLMAQADAVGLDESMWILNPSQRSRALIMCSLSGRFPLPAETEGWYFPLTIRFPCRIHALQPQGTGNCGGLCN